MLTLHHLEYSQSFRILWLFEELGAPYEIKLYNRDPKTHLAPPEYKALSPTGAAPVVTDGELVLAETSAIMDHILDKHPGSALRPGPDSPDRTAYLFWSHTAQGSVMPAMLIDSILRVMVERVPFFIRPLARAVLKGAGSGFIRPRLNALFDQAEKDLAETGWFAGDDLTAADILLSYPMQSAQMRGYMSEDYPHCQAWFDRIYARPSFKAAKEIDGRTSMVLPL
ncbi:glutathione binding-like protein [Sphingorhabdus sp. Alg231-15]|uniref:glutathione binding-like protein n=1 Tax=Sphingorhabdus sp. Alg231-15 TaxID=1922222 RepID=UPI000D54BC92